MTSYRYKSGSNLVQMTIDGTVSRDQFQEIAHGIREFVALAEELHLEITVAGNGGMSPVVFWNDLKSALRYLTPECRVALITDDHRRMWLEMSAKVLTPCPLALFSHGQNGAARTWLVGDAKGNAAAA